MPLAWYMRRDMTRVLRAEEPPSASPSPWRGRKARF